MAIQIQPNRFGAWLWGPEKRRPKAALLGLLMAAAIASAGCRTEAPAKSGDSPKAAHQAMETEDSIQGGDSPEAVHQAICDAVPAEDWRKMAGCLSPETRERMAGFLLIMTGFATRNEEHAAALRELFKRHGIPIPEAPLPVEGKEAPEEQSNFVMNAGAGELLKKALASIKDKAAFIAEMVPLINKMHGQQISYDTARLADLKIEGNKATAVRVINQDGKERREPVEFRKIDGRWYVHVPNLRTHPMTRSTPFEL